MIFQEFQEFRKILCVCPCCGDLVRVSDLKLKAGTGVRTWLDEYDKKVLAMDKKEDRFDEKESELRENAREKGRKEAEKAIAAAVDPKFKALKLNPYDIKSILNPVDFVVFDGMNKDNLKNILFLSKSIRNPALNVARKQVKNTVEQKNYEWKVARIDAKGNIGLE